MPEHSATLLRPGGASSGDLTQPSHACFELFGRKWAPQIIAALLSGPRRFSSLHAAIPGLSEKVLSSRLAEFEAEGILTRQQYPEIPARVEYTLTEAGLAFEPVIREMTRWNSEFRHGNEPGSQR